MCLTYSLPWKLVERILARDTDRELNLLATSSPLSAGFVCTLHNNSYMSIARNYMHIQALSIPILLVLSLPSVAFFSMSSNSFCCTCDEVSLSVEVYILILCTWAVHNLTVYTCISHPARPHHLIASHYN